jgi:hypothetical protein
MRSAVDLLKKIKASDEVASILHSNQSTHKGKPSQANASAVVEATKVSSSTTPGSVLRKKRSVVTSDHGGGGGSLSKASSPSSSLPSPFITNEKTEYDEDGMFTRRRKPSRIKSTRRLEMDELKQAMMQDDLLYLADAKHDRSPEQNNQSVVAGNVNLSDFKPVVFKNRNVCNLLNAEDFTAHIRSESQHIELWDEKAE